MEEKTGNPGRKPPLIPRVSAATEGRGRVRGRHVLAALRTPRVAGCRFLPAVSQRGRPPSFPVVVSSRQDDAA